MLDLTALSDDMLTRHLQDCVRRENESLAEVIRALAEFDCRRIHERKAFPTLFEYCTKALGYSEDAAYRRIHAARLAVRFPSILTLLEEGELSLAAVNLLGPHLTSENHRGLLRQARGKTKRELEVTLASLSPKHLPQEVIRRISTPATSPSSSNNEEASPRLLPSEEGNKETSLLPADATREDRIFPSDSRLQQKIEPLAPQRIRFAFTGNQDFLDKVERCRQLLRHKHPTGMLEDIFTETVEAFLDERDPDRRTNPPRRSETDGASRRIPRWVQNEVWKRDEGRCSFTSDDGRRCGSRDFLEFDHMLPWAMGGKSNDSKNIRLLCRAHNLHQARAWFGERGRA